MEENSWSLPVPVPGREGEEGRLSLVVDAMNDRWRSGKEEEEVCTGWTGR
jgi:hypothetical protein